MKLTVLTDNNTFIDQYYLGEPALSIYIEDGEERILFDTGYSDAFMKNAEALGIDLSKLTAIVFSHGHNDHTRGLSFLMDKTDLKGVKVIAHPSMFLCRRCDGLEVGAPYALPAITAKGMRFLAAAKPYRISSHLTFLGEIPRVTSFEGAPVGEYEEDGICQPDYVLDDSALLYEGSEGAFIITGCSHSGICNIVRYAKEVSGQKITGILGGFHLLKDNEQLQETIRFLKENMNGTLYPCHCVSHSAKCRMMNVLDVQEVGVGLALELK